MSIYVYVTRRAKPFEPGPAITFGEWQAVAVRDPSFRRATPDDYAKLGFPVPQKLNEMIWTGHPSVDACWFDWFDGQIDVKNPDEAGIAKMMSIAVDLGATVVSEMSEIFNADGSHKGFVDGVPW